MRLQPGEIVDRYVVDHLLGEGGMATVYRVRHTLLGSTHALKVLAAELVGDPRIRERFLSEGRIQAQLQHPNIVRVTDVVADDGIAALVMEFIEGPTLAEWIEERGALPAAEILALFLPVLDAVGAAHARGILHRDLKPSNILVGTDGAGRLRPVVLDFGIARITEAADDSLRRSARTRTGAHLGTPAWMSPEQVRGMDDLDARSDVFSLGAILYELASGVAAFEADSEFDTMNRVVSGTWEGPLEAIPGDPRGGIEACVERALQLDREARFPSAEAFREALIAATAEPAAPAFIVMAQPISEGGTTLHPEPEPREPEAGEPPTRRPRRWRRAIVLLLVLAAAGLGARVAWDDRAAARMRKAERTAEQLTDRAMKLLERRQTEASANADPAVLDAAMVAADQAVTAAPIPRALAVQALIGALHGGWHLRQRAWTEDEFGVVEARTRSALVLGSSVEAELARAIVVARACRLLPARDTRQAGFCAEAEQRFEKLRPRLRLDGRGWLRVEHGWISVGFLNALAEEADAVGQPARRGALAARALATCADAGGVATAQAVNAGFLLSACLSAAGHASDYAAYYRFARQIRADDEGPDGKLQSSNVRLLYESAGPAACRSMRFDKQNRYKRTLPSGDAPAITFCTVVGLYALDCPIEAALMSATGKLFSGDSTLPWGAPTAGWHLDAQGRCYLRADVGD